MGAVRMNRYSIVATDDDVVKMSRLLNGTLSGRRSEDSDPSGLSPTLRLSNNGIIFSGVEPSPRKRFVRKNGQCNVSFTNMEDKPRRYMADIFTTCVDVRWRSLLFLFTAISLLSWLLFALVFWFVALAHGDTNPVPISILQQEPLPPHSSESPQQSDPHPWQPCILHVHSFTSAFLFSVETQTTLGYGYRCVTEECPLAVLAVVVQCIVGCVVDTLTLGTIMAKMARPKKRAQTLLFSRHAVVAQRDGRLCLMWRLGNLRRSHVVEAHVRAQLLRPRITPEGEYLPLEQVDLDVGYDEGLDRLFLVTPQVVIHEITESSPLYDMSQQEVAAGNFEIVVILEGMVEATAMTTQARSSYLPSEILWGHRFAPVVGELDGRYVVDYARFDDTYEVSEMPSYSAKELQRLSSSLCTRAPLSPEHPCQGATATASPSSSSSSLLPTTAFCYENEVALAIPEEECEELDAVPQETPRFPGILGKNNGGLLCVLDMDNQDEVGRLQKAIPPIPVIHRRNSAL